MIAVNFQINFKECKLLKFNPHSMV